MMTNRYDTRERHVERFCQRNVHKMSDADLDLALQLNSVQADRPIRAALEKERARRLELKARAASVIPVEGSALE